MIKLPPSNSVSLSSVEMREDFPAPVLPTMPTLSPPARIHLFMITRMSNDCLSLFLPISTLTPLRTRGSSGLYLKLTFLNCIPPLWGQSVSGLLDSMMAGASCLRLVYSKFLAKELVKATKLALRFITKGTKVAVWKTLTMTNPATAGGTWSWIWNTF